MGVNYVGFEPPDDTNQQNQTQKILYWRDLAGHRHDLMLNTCGFYIRHLRTISTNSQYLKTLLHKKLRLTAQQKLQRYGHRGDAK